MAEFKFYKRDWAASVDAGQFGINKINLKITEI